VKNREGWGVGLVFIINFGNERAMEMGYRSPAYEPVDC
jgi:uncharacterized protein (DUF1330 family)